MTTSQTTTKPSIADVVSIQEMEPCEKNLIRQSWIRSYQTRGLAPFVHPEIYFPKMTGLVNDILAHESTRVYTAKISPDSDIVLGYAVFRKLGSIGNANVLYYIFVKQDYRKNGIASLFIKRIFKPKSSLKLAFFPGTATQFKSRRALQFLGRPFDYIPIGFF